MDEATYSNNNNNNDIQLTVEQQIAVAIREKTILHHEGAKQNRINYSKRRKEITELRERTIHFGQKHRRIEMAEMHARHAAIMQSERAAQRKLRVEIYDLQRLQRNFKN